MGRIAFGVFADDAPLSALIGVLLYGRPAARLEEQERTLELRRMFLMDVTAKNAESRVIAYTLRYVRRYLPEIERVIAYSDPSAGHDGTIYRASGFALVSIVPARDTSTDVSWQRPNSQAHRTSEKRKYERRIK